MVLSAVLMFHRLSSLIGYTLFHSIAITSVLLLGAVLGYWVGGSREQRVLPRLKRFYLYSALLISAGFSNFFIALYFQSFYRYVTTFQILPLMIYLIVIPGLTFFFLGQVVSQSIYLIKIPTKSRRKVSTAVLELTAIGWFLGTGLSLYLFPHYVGDVSIFWISIALLLLIVIILLEDLTQEIVTISLLVAVVLIAYAFNVVTLDFRYDISEVDLGLPNKAVVHNPSFASTAHAASKQSPHSVLKNDRENNNLSACDYLDQATKERE